MSTKKVACVTFGCKVNKSETEDIIQTLSEYDTEMTDNIEDADILIVNTCAVTEKAEIEGKKYLAKMSKNMKNGVIIATGCLAELLQDSMHEYGVNINVVNAQKDKLLDTIKLDKKEHRKKFTTTTRMFIKIQDGCNCNCSYCIIPLLRGKSKSIPMDRITNKIEKAIHEGIKEIVLTGINIQQYGSDINSSIIELLNNICLIEGDFRIRLTSLYIDSIDDALIDLVKNSSKLTPHFHISLQSASDNVLKNMNRKYSSKDFLGIIKKIRDSIPNAFIGLDLIVGFPGESEKDFSDTMELFKKLDIFYSPDSIHVFPYSKRPGTIATSMDNQIDESVKKDRARLMRELAKVIGKKRAETMIGQTVSVLSEEGDKGHSENYYLVKLPKGSEVNKIFKVRIKSIEKDFLQGDILS